MLPPEQAAAAAFVARLTELVRTQDDGVSLTEAVAELIAAERRAAVEACARKVERENLYGLAAALRALPLD
jgi:hypothetical protein